MKKHQIAVLAVFAAFGVCAAEGDCVYSSNAHAIVKVETFSTNVLIAVPWTFYTPTGSSDTNLPINRLVKPEGLDDGDMLLNVTQNTPQKYQSWMLIKDKDGIGTWTSVISIENANADVKASLIQKEQQISFGADAESPVSRGIGLWLVRKNPKDGSGNWKPVYLYGQWTKAPASVTVKGGAGVTNAVMIAYPACTKAVKINEDMTWDFVGSKDTLSIPNGGDAWNMAVWNPSEGKWGMEKVTEEVRTFGKRTVIVQTSSWDYDITVPAGCGFWYIRRDVAGDCTISWPE